MYSDRYSEPSFPQGVKLLRSALPAPPRDGLQGIKAISSYFMVNIKVRLFRRLAAKGPSHPACPPPDDHIINHPGHLYLPRQKRLKISSSRSPSTLSPVILPRAVNAARTSTQISHRKGPDREPRRPPSPPPGLPRGPLRGASWSTMTLQALPHNLIIDGLFQLIRPQPSLRLTFKRGAQGRWALTSSGKVPLGQIPFIDQDDGLTARRFPIRSRSSSSRGRSHRSPQDQVRPGSLLPTALHPQPLSFIEPLADPSGIN